MSNAMAYKLLFNSKVNTIFRFLHNETNNIIKVSPTLIDSYQRKHNYLRISVTERCNFRCQYCMPEDGVPLNPEPHLLSTKEIIALSSLFVTMGVDKIRLTGGEPLIRKDILELIGSLSALKSLHTIGITTNGLILHRKLKELKSAGLNAINISLDTMIPTKFEFITRRKGLNHVLKSIETSLDLGFTSVKVNCVVMKGFNDNELGNFVKFTEDKNIDIRFIEFCPFTGNKWNHGRMIPYLEMLNIIRKQYPQLSRIADLPNDTSKAYKVPGFKGQIGFITSMTENFCGSCNRLRLTADGNLKVCLFGKEEVSLRDALRQNISEEELMNIIASAVSKKKKQHAEFLPNSPSLISIHKRNFSSILRSIYICDRSKTLNIFTNFFVNRYFQLRRHLNCSLTHVNEDGEIHMVDVSSKAKTIRHAEAEAKIYLGSKAFQLVKENKIKKGDVISVANIAGIMAAKRTSEFIPLCHSINIDQVKLTFKMLSDKHEILIQSFIKTVDRTGAEMEALTSVTMAALTIYDMCKAVSKDMVIKSVTLTLKTGGKQDFKKL